MHETTDPELDAIRRRKMEALSKPGAPAAGAANGHPVAITDAQFRDFVAADGATLVDFWAPWCGPCKVIAPVLDEMAKEYAGKLAIGKLNVDDNPQSAMEHGVMGIPTLILFKGGKPVERIVGAVPKARLKAVVDKHVA